MIIIPTDTISTKTPSSLGFTAFLSMIIDGRDNAVTAIIKDKIVPSPTPFENNASAIGNVPKISAYIGIPTTVAISTENGLSLPKML